MKEARFAPVVAYLLGGMIVWTAAFAAAYAGTAYICARGLAEVAVLGLAVLPLSLGVVTLVGLAASGLIAVVAYRRRPKCGDDVGNEAGLAGFVPTIAMFLALMAMVAIVWNGVPALFFASCA